MVQLQCVLFFSGTMLTEAGVANLAMKVRQALQSILVNSSDRPDYSFDCSGQICHRIEVASVYSFL